MPPRTSITDPLKIDAMPCGNGVIGMTLCPGKHASSAFGPAWARDLAHDLDTVMDWDVRGRSPHGLRSNWARHRKQRYAVSGRPGKERSKRTNGKRTFCKSHSPCRMPVTRTARLRAWTELGARRMGAIQSLLVTCQLQGVNPCTYLVDGLLVDLNAWRQKAAIAAQGVPGCGGAAILAAARGRGIR